MKFIFALIATLFLAAPAWAVDVQMGSNGNLIFDPAEVTISAGESVHFVNNMLPPHNRYRRRSSRPRTRISGNAAR